MDAIAYVRLSEVVVTADLYGEPFDPTFDAEFGGIYGELASALVAESRQPLGHGFAADFV